MRARRAVRAAGAVAAMVAVSSSWVKPRRRAVQGVLHEPLEAPGRSAFPVRGAVGHEGTAALLTLEVAVLVEIGQGPGHRVAIDPEEARELADGRQLHARFERAGVDEVANLGLELHVDGYPTLPVHPEPGGRDDLRRLPRHVLAPFPRPSPVAAGPHVGGPARPPSGRS